MGYCERDIYAASVIVARIQGACLPDAPVWDCVDTFPAKQFHGCVDLICAGYPCQPFSVAGRQLGTADERHIWPHIRRIIGEVQPEWVFLENVAQHVNLGFGPAPAVEEALQSGAGVLASLSRMGYLVEAGLFAAEEVGANHARLRLFVLAYRTRRRLAELWEPSRRAGFVDRSFEELAHATGLRRREPGEWDGKDGINSGGAGLPIFAPGPNDPRWSEILRVRPDLGPAIESGVRLLADGDSALVDEHRGDQLRCVGNGVVPLCAAYALVTLARRAWEG